MTRKISCRGLLAALTASVLALGTTLSATADALPDNPYVPASTGGLERIERALTKLQQHRRLMIVAAHPDDEDTTLLALVSRGLGGEAAYFSLSRGEGGQNLIGTELGVGLGLLRSRELEAARRIDGARQYFARAFDFGYTRSLDETFERWPREILLEDTVRVMRRFKPQVVVSVFPPDARAGHGQHQAAGVITGEAFRAAGDPKAFPELIAEGLAPWQPSAFYRAAWWNPEGASMTYDLARLEPVSGRSIFQIAMASRSQHRCQDMGMLQPIGPQEGRLSWVEGGAGNGGDQPFAGLDTDLAGLASTLPPGDSRERLEALLRRAQGLAEEAHGRVTAADPQAILPTALEILDTLRQGRQWIDIAEPAADLLDEKIAVAEELVVSVAGLAVDAHSTAEGLIPGEAITLEAALWDAGASGAELLGLEVISPRGLDLDVTPTELPERSGWIARFFGQDQPEKGFYLRAFEVTVPAGSAPSVPYFLERPRRGDLYDWSNAPATVRGEPFGPPVLLARFRIALGDQRLTLVREVVHRHRDQAEGEIRYPLRVMPPLEIDLGRDLWVWPTGDGAPRDLEVLLTSRSGAPVSGRVEVTVPAGWPTVAPASFRLEKSGSRDSVRLQVSPPNPFPPGNYRLGLEAVVETTQGQLRLDLGLPKIDYFHVVPTLQPRRAEVRISATSLAVPGLDRIGYVRGASDRVPEALREVALPIEMLTPETLASQDLSVYDAIVIGSRAYEATAGLAAVNPRLLEYVEAGGLLLVQYQQYAFAGGAFAPYALTIDRPHDRVTDETAAVTPLLPQHPVWTTPNRIAESDWSDWVQERGLYMADTWDEAFVPLLAMADPGGERQEGALLVADYGEGTYIYTGLAFFRQLPAGVPGAYRLFANLLALSGS